MIKIIKFLSLLILAGIIIFPILIAVLGSFVSNDAFIKGDLWPSSLSLENYQLAFKSTPLLHFIINSTIIALSLTIAQLLLSSLAAYALVFINFKSRQVWFGLILSTMMVPFESIFVANFQLIKTVNLLDTYAGITLPFVASAFSIFFLRQTFKQIPLELQEAAQISGLNHLQFYSKVIMPMSNKALMTLGTYLFISAWNMYLWPLIVTSNNRVQTVQIGLRQLKSSETFAQWGTIMAAAVIVVLPSLIILFFTQNRLQEGLAQGAIK